VDDAAQALRVAFAGVEVGDWVDPTGESRDVAVRCTRMTAWTPATSSACQWPWWQQHAMVPLEQIAKITMDKGPSRSSTDGKRTDHGVGQRPGSLARAR
jgi:HAE1 family hydrophobic/amphiphilic exporter-1